ncbi:MAG: DNA recombination protein RmuC, partial [Pseudomonadota bacterium]
METLVQIGTVGLDAIHLSLIGLILALFGGGAWLRGQLLRTRETLERDRLGLEEARAEIDEYMHRLEVQRQAAEIAKLDLARAEARSEEEDKRFADLAQGVLRQANAQFLQLANETFEKHKTGAEGQLKAMMQPIGKNFEDFRKRVEAIEKVRAEDKSAIQAQVKAIGESLHRNTAETGKLVNALTAPKGGGR